LLTDNWRLKPQLYNQSPPSRTDVKVDNQLNRWRSLRFALTVLESG
jgi:hypothetical protein